MRNRFDPLRSIEWIGEVNDANLKKAFRQLNALIQKEQDGPIFFLVKSSGGDMEVGFAFYHYIRLSRIRLTSIAFSEVSSMGVILFVAGHRRIMMPDASLFLHEPTIELKGYTMDETKREARKLKNLRAQYVSAIHRASGEKLARKKISRMMEEKTTLNAKTSVRLHIAHEIWTPTAIR